MYAIAETELNVKTTIEVEFKNARQAQQAAGILNKSKTDEETRAVVRVANNKNKVRTTITANDFTALRALSTTILRDLKVIINGFEVIQGG